MYRFLNLRNVYNHNLQYCVDRLSLTNEVKFRSYYCFYCQNTQNHLHRGNLAKFQSTHAALSRKPSRKRAKMKNFLNSVELLEVNDKAMTETQASVSKLNAKHISQLIANSQLSLSELHKLKLTKRNESKALTTSTIDKDLHKEIEDVMLNRFKQDVSRGLKEDDCAIIFTSQRFPTVGLFQTSEQIKAIKDSYDKFRRDTVCKQKMKDIVLAINEGLHQYENNTNEHFPKDNASKTRPENFKELLLAMKRSESGNIQNVFHDLEEKGVHFPSRVDFIEDRTVNVPSVTKSTPAKASDLINDLQNTRKKNKKSAAANIEIQNKEFQLQAKEFSLNKLLACHLDVCISAAHLEKGFQIFKYFRRRGQRNDSHPKLKNINLYNILLRGFAQKGDISTIDKILSMISSDGLDLNIESYAAIFECVDRCQIPNKERVIMKYKDRMEREGLRLNDLVVKVDSSEQQVNHILSSIRIVQPLFEPKFDKINMDYDCELVNSLNPKQLLKENLQKYSSPAEGLFSNISELIDRAKAQIENEQKGIIEINNIINKGNPSDTVLYYRSKLDAWESETKKNLQKAFSRNLVTLKAQSNASPNPLNILPYLNLLKVDDYVNIMMAHIKKLANGSESYSPSTRSLQKELGQKVYEQYTLHRKKADGVTSKTLKLYVKYCDWYLNRKTDVCEEKFNPRRAWEEIIFKNDDGTSLNALIPTWPVSVCICIGKFLHNIIMSDVQIDINVMRKNVKRKKLLPAFYSVYRRHGYIRKNEVKPHPVLVKLVTESACPTLVMETALVPSFCPPLPWTSPSKGGYLISESIMIRLIMGSIQQLKLLEEAPPRNLYPSLDSLNQLGSIPWQVNQPILDLMIKIFRNGGSEELNVACHANNVAPPPTLKKLATKKEKSLAYRLKIHLAKQKQEMHSLWCDLLYKLSLANHYRDKVFWLPHSIDFRGRTYPCPPHLSHLGSDVSRAIMKFAKGMPLGPNGLKWLKIQCINLTGTMKKSTINERLVCAERIIDKILDSADRPLDGKRWWAQSEDPWQTLACCMEIGKAMRSPNHQEYICHIPIHQDGSCNGLQHYAALGRDNAGAYSVNLSAAEKPQDVYSAVVNLVESSRIQDAANGVEIAQILEGFIRRKVIKQTIMTTVYGVTKFGARLQIAKQLKDINDFPKQHVWSASFYLTKKTFESLTEMFTSTKQIQDWFTECARLISSVKGDKVEWVTPLGLPIIQPYHKASKVVFNAKDTLLEYASYDQHEKPCTMKQKNAFPPNFIHSLDASHMMLTSLYCQANNMTFVSVHDCFWTHAATVELMNKICREQFVALHSQPILESLSEFLYNKYRLQPVEVTAKKASYQQLLLLLKSLPERGEFDLNNVLKSTYFFS